MYCMSEAVDSALSSTSNAKYYQREGERQLTWKGVRASSSAGWWNTTDCCSDLEVRLNERTFRAAVLESVAAANK